MQVTVKIFWTYFSRYYDFSGEGNNIKDPMRGARGLPFIRTFNQGFENGINTVSSVRTSQSPRSDSVFTNNQRGINNNRFLNNQFLNFRNFYWHDFIKCIISSNTSLPAITNEMATYLIQLFTHEVMNSRKAQLLPSKLKGGFNCCNPSNDPFKQKLISANPCCAPIKVQSNDQCYGNSVSCLNYIKLMKSFYNCQLDETALPINFHTPYMDCELIFNWRSQQHLDQNGGKFDASNNDKMAEIFIGFDGRSGMLPTLIHLLTLFARFFNIIFDELRKTRPSASSQSLSFEARKITCAAYQRIMLEALAGILSMILFE